MVVQAEKERSFLVVTIHILYHLRYAPGQGETRSYLFCVVRQSISSYQFQNPQTSNKRIEAPPPPTREERG
jgi:hypothetical protein